MNRESSPLRKRLCLATAFAFFASALVCAITNDALAAINRAAATSAIAPDVAALIAKAQQALKQGHPEVAVIYLKNAESVAPDVASVHFDLGQSLLAVNNPSEAERELNIALQKGVATFKVLPFIFQAMLAQHQGQLLLNKYAAPAQNDHSTLAVDTLKARASAQAQTGRKDDAVVSLEKALAISRTAPNLIARAQLAQDMGDAPLATKLIDEALSKEPSNTGSLMMKITMLQRSNQAEAALPYANTLIKVTHNAPLAMVARAGIYLQLKQDANASTDLNSALSAAPNFPTAIFYQAVIKARAKDAKGAWALAQTLPRAYLPSRPDIGVAVSQMALDAGQTETGIDILHTTVQTFPANVDARINLARAYLSNNEVAQARDTLLSLQNSSDPRPIALLAQIYAQQKNSDQALKYFEKANGLGFGGDALKLQIATSELQRGNLDGAQKLLQELDVKKSGRPEVAGPLISVFLRKKDFASATKVANTFSAAAPKNPYGSFYLGQISAQKGDIDAAIVSFTAALARDPKFVPAIYDRATLLAARGDSAAAQLDLQSIKAIDPKNATAAIRLAQLYGQIGQDDKGLTLLKNAAALNPKDLPVFSALAQWYASHHRLSDAAATMATFLRTSPDDATAKTLQADIQLASGAVDAAINAYTGLLKIHPGSQDLVIMLARAYEKKSDHASARNTLTKAIAAEPKAAALYVGLVQQDLLMKNQTAALADARNFVEKVPGPASAQLLAAILVVQKKTAEAEQLLHKSLSDFPDGRTAVQLATLLQREGKTKAGDDIFLTWLSQRPDDLAIRDAFAVSIMARDRLRAQQQFRIVLTRNAYDLEALNNLAWLLKDNDPKGALILAERAVKLAPNSASVLDTLGWIKWQSNDRAGALSLLQRASSSAPADPAIGYHFAVALAASNRVEEARKILGPILKGNKFFDDRDRAQQLSARIH